MRGRYDLAFEVDDEGVLRSKHFRGFRLAAEQQLAFLNDELPDFTQCAHRVPHSHRDGYTSACVWDE